MLDNSDDRIYDVAIVGGGIVGAAALFLLSRYTNISKIILLEKEAGPGLINSNPENNSQTLHIGDIETNYSLEKAKRVKTQAAFLEKYLEKFAPKDAFRRINKMVLAVGREEVQELAKRYEIFKSEYPNLRKIGKEEIGKLEPRLVDGRNPSEPLLALVSQGYAVDFGMIAASFIEEAKKSQNAPQVLFQVEVKSINPKEKFYELLTPKGKFLTKTVFVAAGPKSLVFAKKLGYGKEFGILPVAGNFYRVKNALQSKVYMMQIPGMPFAAIHGDPNIKNPEETRFGPTIRVLPLLERHNYKTMKDFLVTSVWSLEGVFSLIKITFSPKILRYVIKNIFYDLPFIGKRLFTNWELRKIIPLLRPQEVSLISGVGGIRPQVVNVKKKELEFGEAEIVGKNIIFSITPSPGASVALGYAKSIVQKIIEFLRQEFYFDKEKFKKDFLV
jgi:malate dehydrogenase (quinone)